MSDVATSYLYFLGLTQQLGPHELPRSFMTETISSQDFFDWLRRSHCKVSFRLDLLLSHASLQNMESKAENMVVHPD